MTDDKALISKLVAALEELLNDPCVSTIEEAANEDPNDTNMAKKVQKTFQRARAVLKEAKNNDA